MFNSTSTTMNELLLLLEEDPEQKIANEIINLNDNEPTSTEEQDAMFKANITLKEGRLENPEKVDHFVVRSLLQDDNSYSEPPNKFLFSPPFSIGALGVKGAGKSTWLGNVVKPYVGFFDTIFLFSKTQRLCPTMKQIKKILKVKPENIFSRYSEVILRKIVDQAEIVNSNKKQKDKLRIFIIFDDICDQIPRGLKETAFNDLSFNHRHLNISWIFLSQYYTKIPPPSRPNYTGWLFWRQEDCKERKKIIESRGGFLGKELFEQIFHKATKVKHRALTINYQADIEYQYTMNFNRQIPEVVAVAKRLRAEREQEENIAAEEDKILERGGKIETSIVSDIPEAKEAIINVIKNEINGKVQSDDDLIKFFEEELGLGIGNIFTN